MNWDERKTMDGLPIVAADGGLRDRRYNVEEPKSPGTDGDDRGRTGETGTIGDKRGQTGMNWDERKTMDGLPIVAAVF